MKKYVVLLLCFASFSAFAAETVFVSGFEDLPLMDGLKQSEGAAVAFDSPDGRIVEAYAQSDDAAKQKIMAYYAKTLPQLGWKKQKSDADSLSFLREEEELSVSVDDGTPATVRFKLMTRDKD